MCGYVCVSVSLCVFIFILLPEMASTSHYSRHGQHTVKIWSDLWPKLLTYYQSPIYFFSPRSPGSSCHSREAIEQRQQILHPWVSLKYPHSFGNLDAMVLCVNMLWKSLLIQLLCSVLQQIRRLSNLFWIIKHSICPASSVTKVRKCFMYFLGLT